MEVTLVDSPVANTANIARALGAVGAELRITSDAQAIAQAGKIVLPGVGSFRAAMGWVTANGIDIALRAAVASGSSLLGICVGHQLLFDSSDEMGSTPGLGFVRGEIRRLQCTLPIPQIGWNRVQFDRNALFEGDAPFYFVNSYAAHESAFEIGSATYGTSFTAAVQRERVFGVQFHPEKSSDAGLQVLRNFVEKVR
jgi:glutamine amidotransferase